MSKELPALKPRQAIAALKRAGFEVGRQTGSHVILYKGSIHHPISIPLHSGDLPKGTLRAIIRQAGLSVDEFLALI